MVDGRYFKVFQLKIIENLLGQQRPGMEKCKRHRKGSSRPFLTLIRHQSRLPQLKDRSSSDELTWNLSYAWSNFTKTVQKRTSKEENTKNHCFNPQCRKSLCNSFIRDWNVSEKNGKIKTETTFYFHILFVKSCKARFYCCPGSSIPTLGHWLGLSLPLQNLKTERKQVWILPHTSTIDHWQYSKIMNLKLWQFPNDFEAHLLLNIVFVIFLLFLWRKQWWQWNVRGPARVRQVSLSPSLVQGQCRCQGGSPVLSHAPQ